MEVGLEATQGGATVRRLDLKVEQVASVATLTFGDREPYHSPIKLLGILSQLFWVVSSENCHSWQTAALLPSIEENSRAIDEVIGGSLPGIDDLKHGDMDGRNRQTRRSIEETLHHIDRIGSGSTPDLQQVPK